MAKKEFGNFTEAELKAFISESPAAFASSKKQVGQSEQNSTVDPSERTSPSAEEDMPPSIARRVSSKQRKLSLDEYRATFLQVPKVVNRCPVFVSEEVRQKLDLIVLRLSDTRRMSVTGLLENICRHHIAMYENDIEQWRKL